MPQPKDMEKAQQAENDKEHRQRREDEARVAFELHFNRQANHPKERT